MTKFFRPVPVAVITMQVLVAGAAYAADTRASGSGVCEIYDAPGSVEFSYENCRIVSHASDHWSKFQAEGFETEFVGDAMADDVITQAGESYVRSDEETKWCYNSQVSDYAICFTPG